MCGFAALFEPERTFDPDLLVCIDKDLAHRGPDSAGQLSEMGFALVFRRLAILDITEQSDQPMVDPSGRYIIVFNGEIYNYRELRRQLELKGIRFRTSGDTEVLLQGFATWGLSILDRLEGMFAFVIIDRDTNTVTAARDPFGIKPLYICRNGPLVGFASEARPLRRITDSGPDPKALSELLLFRFAAGRLSNFTNIERVLPGTIIQTGLNREYYGEQRYNNILDTLNTTKTDIDEKSLIETTDELLRQSVVDHTASDVGYAVQLSGGIDSSLVATMLKTTNSANIHSFGLYLGDNEHDERPYREIVVEKTGLNHHEIPVDGHIFADTFERAVHHMEGPSPHLGCILLLVLCESIRNETKVVLTGEGADEMFGGYSRYSTWRNLMKYRTFAKLVPEFLWPMLQRYQAIKVYAHHDPSVYASVQLPYLDLLNIFPDLIPGYGARESASSRFEDIRTRMFAVDQTAHLESLLLRQDKMAMAASVESRVPFVTTKLLKYTNSLPHQLRAPGRVTKPILKAVARRYYPNHFVDRRKSGLTLPLVSWLSDSNGLGRYLETLVESNSILASYGNKKELRRMVKLFRNGNTEYARALVHCINLELWLRDVNSPLRTSHH